MRTKRKLQKNLAEFYQIAFREMIYDSIEMLQYDQDEWLREYNESRPHKIAIDARTL